MGKFDLDRLLADEAPGRDVREPKKAVDDLPPVPLLPGETSLARSGEKRLGRNLVWPTEELTARAVEAIEQGAAKWVAVAASGVSHEKWRKWYAARHDDTEYGRACADFFQAIEEAHTEAAARASRAVFASDPKTWLMKGPGRELRREQGPAGWGEGWGDHSRVELTGAGGGPLQSQAMSIDIDATKLSRDERAALRRYLEKARPDDPDRAPATRDEGPERDETPSSSPEDPDRE